MERNSFGTNIEKRKKEMKEEINRNQNQRKRKRERERERERIQQLKINSWLLRLKTARRCDTQFSQVGHTKF